MDWNSHTEWIRQIRGHHDIEPAPSGGYYALSEDKIPYNGYTCLFDTIVHISDNGDILDKWSTYDHFDEIKKHHPSTTLDDENTNPADDLIYSYYHMNTFRLLPENTLGKTDKRFQKGNWLLCLRNVNYHMTAPDILTCSRN